MRLARPPQVILAVLFTMLVPSGFLNDETRTLIRALARAAGCPNPSLAANWSEGQMEVVVTCPKVREAEP